MFTKRSALLLAALLVAATVSLPAAVAAASATVRVTDRLEPATLRVTAGTTVTWRNDSGERHRMRSVDHAGDADWDTGNIEAGERASITFSMPGSFAYLDDRDDDNPAFHGTVIVLPGGGGGAAPSQPAATANPGAPGAPAGPATPTAATVLMAGRAFSPRSVTIAAGGTVTFHNNDDDEHTATATDVAWDSGVLAPGAAFDRRFPTPGTFAFLCLLHSGMQGTVSVQAAGNTAPDLAPAQPAPTARPTAPAGPAATPSAPPFVVPGRPAAPAAGTFDVTMVDLAFEPATIEAVAGSTIRWTNEGTAPHTATAENGAFDSGIVPSGGTFQVTLDTPDTFAYVCQLHPGMAGSIVVAADAASPTGTRESPAAATASSGASSTAPPSSSPDAASASSSPASPTSAPVAVADPDSGVGSAPGSGGQETAATAPARTSVDLTRLGIVILLVGAAMGLFGRIVRSVVRPG